MIYWTKENQLDIEKYINANDKERNGIINRLLISINNIMNVVMNTYNQLENEDLKQDLYLLLLTKLLPSLNNELIKGFQNYLYISFRNYTINYIKKEVKFDELKYIEDSLSECNTDNYLDLIDNRVAIIEAIDSKMNDEKIFNKYKCIYLQLLKDYLIENDFDERGFMQYAVNKMNINNNVFRSISSSLKISVKPFNSH